MNHEGRASHEEEEDDGDDGDKDAPMDVDDDMNLLDENADDKDEKFVANQRTSTISDGTLACPCCFTTLCYECQQHVEFKTQFRAITAKNVRVKHDQVLMYENETYAPVSCSGCGYECGVFGPGEEEIYHFFDVICSDPL